MCIRGGLIFDVKGGGIKLKLQEVSRSEAAGGFQYHISLLRTIETDTDQNKEKRELPHRALLLLIPL